MKPTFAAITSALLVASTLPMANAAQGDHIVVFDSSAPIVLTYLDGGGAGNTNLLYLVLPPVTSDLIFNNKAADNLPYLLDPLAAGTELVFRLNSDDSDNWFTGPASRNSDLFAHAIVTDMGDNTVRVAFEDLPGGGDQNFADMVFSVSNASVLAAVPEPETYALMLAGLGLVAWSRRRRSSGAALV